MKKLATVNYSMCNKKYLNETRTISDGISVKYKLYLPELLSVVNLKLFIQIFSPII